MALKTWGAGSTAGADGLWSTATNWTGDTVPVTTDDVLLNATSSNNLNIDNVGTWSGGTFTIASGYEGDVTQNVTMTTAAFSITYSTIGTHGYTQAANLTTTTFAYTSGGNVTCFYTVSGARNLSTTTMGLSSGTITFTTATITSTGTVSMSGVTGLAVAPVLIVYAPTGTWTMQDDFTCTYDILDDTYLTFEQQGGTIAFTSTTASVIDVPDFVIGINFDGLFTFNKSTGTVTISLGNVIPVGDSPTVTTGSFTCNGHITTSGNIRFLGSGVNTLTFGTDGGIIENGNGALTNIRLTNKSLTITTGADIPSTPTLLFDGSTGNHTYTKTSGAISIGIVTINRTGDGGLIIAAGTTANLGTDPVCAANLFTVNGTIQVTGVFTLTHTASAVPAIMTVSATGTISGAVTEMRLGFGLTFTAGATVPSGMILTINMTDDELTIITTPGYDWASGSSINASIGSADFLLVSGTMDLGNNPTTTYSPGSGTLSIRGTIYATGIWTITGSSFTVESTGPGTINAASDLDIVLTENNVTVQASGVITGPVGFTMNFTTGSPRTFAGGGKTFRRLTRTGSGTGGATGLIITGTNTFTEGIYDTQGAVAHVITFPNVTTTVGGFRVNGSTGKLVTLARTGGAGTFTLTKTTPGDVVLVHHISVSNSTVDASPLWYAGLTPPSVNGGGNTNWIFTPAPNANRRQLSQVIF